MVFLFFYFFGRFHFSERNILCTSYMIGACGWLLIGWVVAWCGKEAKTLSLLSELHAQLFLLEIGSLGVSLSQPCQNGEMRVMLNECQNGQVHLDQLKCSFITPCFIFFFEISSGKKHLSNIIRWSITCPQFSFCAQIVTNGSGEHV
jgi:hypothetical protein